MTDWTVTSGSVDWIHNYWQQACTGCYSLDLNGTASAAQPNPAGTISETFPTSEYMAYAVTFELAGNPACGPSTKGLTVNAQTPTSDPLNTPFTTHLTFDTSHTTTSNMGWTEEGPFVIAGGPDGSNTLTFTADPGNTSNCGPAIANVVVTNTGYTYGAPFEG